MKILTVVGARPQFIKAAAVSRTIAITEGISEAIAHTGQHFDQNMSDVFFEQMDIPKPNFRLDVHGLNHGAMTGRMMEGIENIVFDYKPDALLVYGDTNSTLAGALVASKLHVPVVHVEAGLRSHNMRMPEEVNRILVDRVSSLLLCPTQTAVNNLIREGYGRFDASIHRVGDVMQDCAIYYGANMAWPVDQISPMEDFVLVTIHRAENTNNGGRLDEIIAALNKISADQDVVFPVHPRTRVVLSSHILSDHIHLIEPVGYFEMLSLLKHSSMVMTDSGGLQKEAFFFQKPCVTLRDETEWTELIDSGFNTLAGATKETILSSFAKMKTVEVSDNAQLYGGGTAAVEIVDALVSMSEFQLSRAIRQ